MTVTARGKHSNPGEDVRIVKQNNPNHPRHTEALGNKEYKPAFAVTPEIGLLLEQKQNSDKQLGTISQNLLGNSL